MKKRIERFIKMLTEDAGLRCRSHCGEGSSREVYRLGNIVVKLPRNFFQDGNCYSSDADSHGVNKYGVLQSLKEIEVWERATEYERSLLAKIYCHGTIDGYPYIAMESIEVAEDMDIFDCSTDEMLELAEEKGFKIIKSYQRVVNILCEKYNLKDGDFFYNEGNFGITRDKRIVLCDYGFCGWDANNYK